MIQGMELTLIPQLEEDKTYRISIPKGSIVGTNDMIFGGISNYSIHTAGNVFFQLVIYRCQ